MVGLNEGTRYLLVVMMWGGGVGSHTGLAEGEGAVVCTGLYVCLDQGQKRAVVRSELGIGEEIAD